MAQSRISDLIAGWDHSEVWRPVSGWPGYEVSSWGNVRNARGSLRLVYTHGYALVSLCRNGTVRNRRVHRLVAFAFLGDPPFEGALVAHNDGDSTNNRVGNLRWASHAENQADRERHDTKTRGSEVHNSVLTEVEIPAIRDRIANGERYPSIARDYGVSISTISLIKLGRIWRHV